jgi:hypothetical protein
MVGVNRPRFHPELPFSKLRRRVDKRPEPGIRNPPLTQIVREFAAQVDEGGTSDFGVFLDRHPLARLVGQPRN